MILTDGRLLKRSTVSGPVSWRIWARPRGTISPPPGAHVDAADVAGLGSESRTSADIKTRQVRPYLLKSLT